MTDKKEPHWLIKHALQVAIGVLVVAALGYLGNKLFQPKPETTIEIKAVDFDDSVNVSQSTFPSYGEVILNAPPYPARHNRAVWKFNALAKRYAFFVEYASPGDEIRSVRILINGAVVDAQALDEPRRCAESTCQDWSEIGVVHLNDGENTVIFDSPSVFPHIRTLKFEVIQ